MINLEVFGESAAMKEVAELLDDVDGVSRVRLITRTTACSRTRSSAENLLRVFEDCHNRILDMSLGQALAVPNSTEGVPRLVRQAV